MGTVLSLMEGSGSTEAKSDAFLCSNGQELHSDSLSVPLEALRFLLLFLCALSLLFAILELRNRQRKPLTTRFSLKQPKNVTKVSKGLNLAEYSS